MFFVFGSPRSGTTLLAQCLSSHSDIIIPYETDFIVPLAFACDMITDPPAGRDVITKLIIHSARFDTHLGEYMTRRDVERVVQSCDYSPSAIVEAIYSELARACGVKIAGDKSPNDLLFMRMLIATNLIGPRMKIVHIVRDVRDVLCSLMRTNWDPDIERHFARSWSSTNLYLHTLYHNKPSQYVLVRYEDFVSNPRVHLERICSLLDAPYQEQMVSTKDFHPRYASYSVHEKLFRPISRENIGNFRNKLSQKTVEQFEKQAQEGLEVFGYKLRAKVQSNLVGKIKQYVRTAVSRTTDDSRLNPISK